MIIDKQGWIIMLETMASKLIEEKDVFSEIDSKFGDGDHGITIEKIALSILKSCEVWKNNGDSLKVFFNFMGDAIVNIAGGSAGPLYGTFFVGMSEGLSDEEGCDTVVIKKMFESAVMELSYITNAKVGDKTMMDAILPAVQAISECTGDLSELFANAADAARIGAKNSEQFISKYGRAKSYKEATIGTPDAGAMSASALFTGLNEGFKTYQRRKEERI
jgi:phosphoenolpyruvate---glycerone phosphotransferase subunit DhaL